jgi:hypothetical protein
METHIWHPGLGEGETPRVVRQSVDQRIEIISAGA